MQVWMQLELASGTALKRIRRLVARSTGPEGSGPEALIKPELQHHVDEMVAEDERGEEPQSEEGADEGEEEEEGEEEDDVEVGWEWRIAWEGLASLHSACCELHSGVVSSSRCNCFLRMMMMMMGRRRARRRAYPSGEEAKRLGGPTLQVTRRLKRRRTRKTRRTQPAGRTPLRTAS